MLLGTISGAFWFAVFVVGHVWLFHARPVSNRFKAIARIFAAALAGHGLAIAVSATWAWPALGGRPWTSLFTGSIVMACLFVTYMPFFFTIGTSLSVQTMILIDRSATGSLPVSELREVFASRQLVRGRLETMVANGYLVHEGDRYRASPKGRMVAGVFGLLKNAWRLGAGG